jgi:hypothetical protein
MAPSNIHISEQYWLYILPGNNQCDISWWWASSLYPLIPCSNTKEKTSHRSNLITDTLPHLLSATSKLCWKLWMQLQGHEWSVCTYSPQLLHLYVKSAPKLTKLLQNSFKVNFTYPNKYWRPILEFISDCKAKFSLPLYTSLPLTRATLTNQMCFPLWMSSRNHHTSR